MLSAIAKSIFRKLTVRYSIVALLFFSNTYMISFRLCMSVAIVAMTSKPKKDFNTNFTDISDHCPEIDHGGNSTDDDSMVKEFHWTNYEQGIILSAYFYGFLVTQLVGGILCQKWSAKHTMTVSLAISGVLSLLNPLAARLGGYGVFIAVRVLVGLFSGCVLSVCYAYVGWWIPVRNRSWATSVTYCGINFGSIVSIGISGWISNLKENEGGWPYIFYLFGTLSLLHIPFWLLTAYDHPEEHPYISSEELEYLSQEIESTHGKSTQYDIPWLKIISSVPFIALSVANFGHNWILDFLQLQIPTYMSQALNYNIKTNALLSATPFILKTLLNCLSGALSDFCYRRFNCSTNFLRKLFNTVSFYGAAIFIFSVTLSGCDGPLNVALLCGATLFSGMCSAGFLCTYVDLCRELSAVMLGLSNTIGNIAGLIAPHLVGYITNEGSSLSQWRIAFYLTSGVFVATGTFFLVFGTSEDQNYLGLRNKEESPLALSSDSGNQRPDQKEAYQRDNLGADLKLRTNSLVSDEFPKEF